MGSRCIFRALLRNKFWPRAESCALFTRSPSPRSISCISCVHMMSTASGQGSRFEFCPDCGAVLDLTATDLVSNTIKCLRCMSSHDIALFLGHLSTSVIVFNDKEQIRKAYVSAKKKKKLQQQVEEESSGPVVEMECPKCKHNRMSYKTLQLRSADEGQTVFFSCLKCGAQFSENS